MTFPIFQYLKLKSESNAGGRELKEKSTNNSKIKVLSTFRHTTADRPIDSELNKCRLRLTSL